MTVNITTIGIGSGPDTHTGEPLRTAFTKVNNNFANLKTVVDGFTSNVSVGNLEFNTQTITGTLENVDITIDPNGIGELVVAGNLRTSSLNFRGNTISTQYAGDLVLNASSGNIKLLDPLRFPDGTVQSTAAVSQLDIPTNVSALTNDANYITSTSLTWGNIEGKPAFATVATSGSYNDLTDKPTIPTVPNMQWALVESFVGLNTYYTSGNATVNMSRSFNDYLSLHNEFFIKLVIAGSVVVFTATVPLISVVAGEKIEIGSFVTDFGLAAKSSNYVVWNNLTTSEMIVHNAASSAGGDNPSTSLYIYAR